MSEQQDIVLAGHVCIDIATDIADFSGVRPGALVEVGPASWSLGGAIGNTGGTLTELGVPIRTAAAIADDELGQSVRRELTAKGLPQNGLQMTAAAGTSYSVVLQAEETDRTFLHYPGANAYFDPNVVDVTEASIVHFGYPSLMEGMVQDSGEPIRALMKRARQAGATTSIDLAVVDPKSRVASLDWGKIFAHILPEVDVASPSLDDITSALGIEEPFSIELVERLAQTFIDAGAAVVALSAGANGVFLKTAVPSRLREGGAVLAELSERWGNTELWQAPFPVPNWSSTNGAGDALTAGLLFSLWSARGPRAAVRTAAACAAIRMSAGTVSPGAVDGMLRSQSRTTAESLRKGY